MPRDCEISCRELCLFKYKNLKMSPDIFDLLRYSSIVDSSCNTKYIKNILLIFIYYHFCK